MRVVAHGWCASCKTPSGCCSLCAKLNTGECLCQAHCSSLAWPQQCVVCCLPGTGQSPTATTCTGCYRPEDGILCARIASSACWQAPAPPSNAAGSHARVQGMTMCNNQCVPAAVGCTPGKACHLSAPVQPARLLSITASAAAAVAGRMLPRCQRSGAAAPAAQSVTRQAPPPAWLTAGWPPAQHSAPPALHAATTLHLCLNHCC